MIHSSIRQCLTGSPKSSDKLKKITSNIKCLNFGSANLYLSRLKKSFSRLCYSLNINRIFPMRLENGRGTPSSPSSVLHLKNTSYYPNKLTQRSIVSLNGRNTRSLSTTQSSLLMRFNPSRRKEWRGNVCQFGSIRLSNKLLSDSFVRNWNVLKLLSTRDRHSNKYNSIIRLNSSKRTLLIKSLKKGNSEHYKASYLFGNDALGR